MSIQEHWLGGAMCGSVGQAPGTMASPERSRVDNMESLNA